MSPRRYTQGRRAAASGATRARIIDAAVDEYRERGLAATSIQSVARRADVSRGTVLNHFGDTDGLLRAVLDTAMDSLEMPDEHVLESATGLEDRARRFAEQMLRFYERTEDWWHVFAGERDELPDLPAVRAEEARFWEIVGRFERAAIGDLAADPSVAGSMAVLVAPTTLGAMKTAGLTVDEGIDVAAGLFTYAVRRAAQSSQVGD